MRRNHVVWLVYTVIVLLILISIVYWLSYRVLYNPTRDIRMEIPETYENIYLELGTKDLRPKNMLGLRVKGNEYINCWYIEHKKDAKVILFCHGNDSNITTRQYVIDLCSDIGLNLFLIDYRGYGKSSGYPTSQGIIEDGEIGYRYLSQRYKHEDIIIWGESLGGPVAANLACKYPCDRLVLFSTFSSLEDVVYESSIDDFLKYPIGLICNNLIDPIDVKESLKEVKCPILIVHSLDDEIIPYNCSKKNIDNCSNSNDARHISIGGKHSCPRFNKRSLGRFLNFLGIWHGNVDVDAIMYKMNKNLRCG